MPYPIAHFIYFVSLALYHAGIRIAAPFHTKARDWVQGRKETWKKVSHLPVTSGKTIWMHCASLGEFEQGRPLLEKLRTEYPTARIVLTFFSPSGYQIRKNYPHADIICYLPADGHKNARRFLDAIQPDIVIFIKYEFWYAFLKQIAQRNIPLYLAAAVFRSKQPFFTWYGSLHRRMLQTFDTIFVQDTHSAQLLKSIGIDADIAYDLRFDRVTDIAANPVSIPEVASFCANKRVIIAGSTWQADEALLCSAYTKHLSATGYRLIIAPHEVNENHLSDLENLFGEHCERLSRFDQNFMPQVLIIDSIGLLSSVYKYAWISYIGGGFGKGIHNTLEAAVYGRPVLFGPRYDKFIEAADLIALGGGYSIHSAEDLLRLCALWEGNPDSYAASSQAASEYVLTHTGGTKKIYQSLAAKLSAES